MNCLDSEIHEECGVFGIYGIENAANLVYYGLHALQHREDAVSYPVMMKVTSRESRGKAL